MNLLLCNTNLAITTVVSQIMEYPEKQYMVMTDQNNIMQFFQICNFSNVTLFFVRSTYGIYALFPLFKEKKKIRKIFSEYKIDCIYFYHQAYGELFDWVINYAHNLNIQIYFNRVLADLCYPELNTIKSKIRIVKYRLLYSSFIKILNRGGNTPLPKWNEKFAKVNEIRSIHIRINPIHIKDCSDKLLSKLNFTYSNDKIILLTGSVVNSRQIEINEYTTKIDLLIKTVGKDRLIAKCHPRYNDEFGMEKELLHIPSFIPMDFLLPNFNIYIGYNSTILMEAANSDKLAISLLEYFIPINIEKKETWYKYFNISPIQYPKDIDQLVSILN